MMMILFIEINNAIKRFKAEIIEGKEKEWRYLTRTKQSLEWT